jgi:endonuclease-8
MRGESRICKETSGAADRIASVLKGKTLQEVWFALPRLARFCEEIRGGCVVGVDAQGKALLIRLERGLSLYAHDQVCGVWYLRERGKWPKTRRSPRVALHTQSHGVLLYGATDIALLTPEEERFHPDLSRLGPDVLDRCLPGATSPGS